MLPSRQHFPYGIEPHHQFKLIPHNNTYYNMTNCHIARFQRSDLVLNFSDEEGFLGEGATGSVYKGQLRIGKRLEAVAFKRFTIQDSLKRTLAQMQAMNTTELLADTASTPNGMSSSSVVSPAAQHRKEMIKKVMREARLAWSFNRHPNCVSLYGVCLDPDSCGIVMQLCNGGALQDRLYRMSEARFEALELLTHDDKLLCATQVIAGVYFLHSQGIVHRDLKTANILVQNYGSEQLPLYSFKLSDFGSARTTKDYMSSLSSSNTSATAGSGQAAFTLRWEPPEVDDIDPTVMDKEQQRSIMSDPAVDVYALGCVLGEIFLGEPPYSVHMHRRDIERAQRNRKAAPFSLTPEDHPRVHPALLSIIQRCCSREPKNRPTICQLQLHDWPAVASALAKQPGSPLAAGNRITAQANIKPLAAASAEARVADSLSRLQEQASSSSVEEQQTACDALAALTLRNPPNARLVASSNGIPSILSAMRSSLHSPTLQAVACNVLANLVFNEPQLQEAVVAADALPTILACMDQHQAHSLLQEKACAALGSLTANHKGHQAAVVSAGGLPRLLAAMKQHSRLAGVQAMGCGALANVCTRNPSVKSHVAALGGILVIREAMTQHAANVWVQENACAALLNLAFGTPDNADKMARAGCIPLVLAVVLRHQDSAIALARACGVLTILTFTM